MTIYLIYSVLIVSNKVNKHLYYWFCKKRRTIDIKKRKRTPSQLPLSTELIQVSKEEEQEANTQQQNKSTNLRAFRNQTEVEELKQKLHEVIVDRKLYKEESISLASVAQEMDTTERKLSELFNKELATNFYEYINTCKIEAFKQSVENGNAQHLIAYESGFHSKATLLLIEFLKSILGSPRVNLKSK